MKYIKRVFLCFIAMMSVTAAIANDCIYFTSGSMLVPIKETNISVGKEILSITIGKDSYATVDVYYEFFNNDSTKNVLMGFEADSPYNAFGYNQNKSGGHPFIKDFTVKMNDKPLKYTNGIVALSFNDDIPKPDFTALDRSQWKMYGEVDDSILPEPDQVYNIKTKEYSGYAYAYYFNATFLPGKNIVHHTYRYRMNESTMSPYEVPYWLTPATRWANHKIDDFTLRVKNEKGDEFYMCDSLFMAAPFKIEGGQGQIYQFEGRDSTHYVLCHLDGKASLVWHVKDFCPESDMEICSAEGGVGSTFLTEGVGFDADIIVDNEGNPEGRYVGHTKKQYFILAQDFCMVDKAGHTVKHLDASDGQGWLYASEDAGKQISVRQKPSEKAPVVAKIKNETGVIPECYECLGMDRPIDEGLWYEWFKVKVNGKIGYVRYDLMKWTPIAF